MRDTLVLLCSLTLTIATAFASPQNTTHKTEAPKPHAAALVVPEGAIIPLELKNTIHSHTAYIGESVYCESIFPVTADDRILIPAHSFVLGTVTDVVQPGRVKGKAQISLLFDTITLPDGTTRPIKATVYSIAGTRLGTSKAGEESAQQPEGADLARSGAGDAVIDASGLGGSSPVSALSQGVGGLVVMLVTRGKDILLRPGTTLEIQLTEPLSFAPLPGGGSSEHRGPPKLLHRPATAANPTPPPKR